MPNLSVMLKPVSSSCNLRCKYCFYHSLAECREQKNYGVMSKSTLETTIKKALQYLDGSRLYLSFHGGEPLLSGIDFFKSAVEYVHKYNEKNSEVILAVQTNGTLIDEEWCKFFKENGFLVGVSLDGTYFANSYRVDQKGESTFDRVVEAIDDLQYYEVDFNILTVVTKYVATHIKNIYEFFTSRGYKYLQFTPCLKPYNNKVYDEDMYMTSKEYGQFLIDLTTLYFDDYMHGNYVSVRQIDNFVRLAKKLPAYQCGMNGNCSYQFTIEADGTVFPCDYYCVDDYVLGKIQIDDFYNMQRGNVQSNFVLGSVEIEEKCKKCKYYALCKNGCKRERRDVDKCEAYTMYFDKMLKVLQFLGQGVEE